MTIPQSNHELVHLAAERDGACVPESEELYGGLERVIAASAGELALVLVQEGVYRHNPLKGVIDTGKFLSDSPRLSLGILNGQEPAVDMQDLSWQLPTDSHVVWKPRPLEPTKFHARQGFMPVDDYDTDPKLGFLVLEGPESDEIIEATRRSTLGQRLVEEVDTRVSHHRFKKTSVLIGNRAVEQALEDWETYRELQKALTFFRQEAA